MLASIHRLIEFALELDHALSLEDRETILACCRTPAAFRDRQREPEERLLPQKQVCEMLGVSRATLWLMCRAGGLRPVVLFHGNKKFKKSDILALMAGEAPRGPTDGLGGARGRERTMATAGDEEGPRAVVGPTGGTARWKQS